MIQELRLEDIIPNPYRNIKDYPTDNTRVEYITKSILKNGFWNILCCRPSPTVSGKFELCYGQHRYEALLKAGYEKTRFEIKDYTNVQMFSMLSSENEVFLLDRSPRFIDEAVEGAKNMIETHINEKNGVWEALDDWCQELFDGKTGFHHTILSHKVSVGFHSQFSVGRKTIQMLLGDGWKSDAIGKALQRIKETVTVNAPDASGGNKNNIEVEISRKALETFDKTEHSDSAIDIFKSTKGRLAFKSKEDQEEAIEEFHQKVATNPNIKVTGRVVKEFLSDKANQVLEINTKPVVYENPYDKEAASNMNTNRKYLEGTYKSFKEESLPLWKIQPYPEHLLHYDRALLLRDIKQRLDLLEQYDDALGYTSITNTRVYDALDCDNAEEFKVMKDYWDIEKDNYGSLPPVEEWLEDTEWLKMEKIEEELKKYEQKDKL